MCEPSTKGTAWTVIVLAREAKDMMRCVRGMHKKLAARISVWYVDVYGGPRKGTYALIMA